MLRVRKGNHQQESGTSLGLAVAMVALGFCGDEWSKSKKQQRKELARVRNKEASGLSIYRRRLSQRLGGLVAWSQARVRARLIVSPARGQAHGAPAHATALAGGGGPHKTLMLCAA